MGLWVLAGWTVVGLVALILNHQYTQSSVSHPYMYAGLLAALLALLFVTTVGAWRTTKRYLRERLTAPGCCPECGYDLTGTTEPRCPECGTDLLPEELPTKPTEESE